MLTVHVRLSPSTVPFSSSIVPCGPPMVPVRVAPSVASVRVPACSPIGVFIVMFQVPSAPIVFLLFRPAARPGPRSHRRACDETTTVRAPLTSQPASRCRAVASSSPTTRNRLVRDVAPSSNSTAVRRSPSEEARARRAASVARPSSGAAVTRTWTTPSVIRTSVLRDFGVTQTTRTQAGNGPWPVIPSLFQWSPSWNATGRRRRGSAGGRFGGSWLSPGWRRDRGLPHRRRLGRRGSGRPTVRS